MKKIIVFGATGDTGLYLIDYLSDKFKDGPYELIAVGRRKTSFFDRYGIRYYQVDVSEESLFEQLPKEDIYAVIALSGILPAVMKGYSPRQYIDVNVVGNFNILEYARAVGADRVLYAQSWSDYAGYVGKKQMLDPYMPRQLLTTGDHALYSITKSAMMDMMFHYRDEFGIKSFVFRLPNIYMYTPQGTYYLDGKETIVAYRYMIGRALNSLPIELWGDPNAGKDIVYIKDLCQMFYKALSPEAKGGVYNVGTGKRTTMREQIEGIIQVFSPENEKSEIIECPEKTSCLEYIMNIDNAKEELGYEPQYGYIDYLEDYKREMELNRFKEMY